jgi:hypothetical protein
LIDRAPRATPPELTLDLACGIDAAMAELDARRPRSVRLTIGRQFVGEVPAEPGAERLRGEHLPRVIARRVEREYLRAAAAAGLVPAVLRPPAETRPAAAVWSAAKEPRAALAPSCDAPRASVS